MSRGIRGVPAGFLAGLTRIRVLNLREIRTHRMRVFTSLIVVVVSSALLVAVLGTFGSFTASVREFNSAISGAADVEVAAIADSGVDAALATELRRELPDAKAVVPLIRGSITVGDKQIPLLGSDLHATALSGDLSAVQGGMSVSLADLDTGVIAGPSTGLHAGQQLTVGDQQVRVLRVVTGAQAGDLNGGSYVFAYLPLAQRLTGLSGSEGTAGRVTSILLVAKPGADVGHLRAEATRIVGGRAVVVNPDFRAKQAELASSVTRDSTLLVALVSLVIAAFLVFNTMNMAVASRRQSLAMVRALGARRSHLVGDMLGEAALSGLVGGAIGVPIGVLAGQWAVSRVPSVTRDGVNIAVGYHLPAYAPVIAVVACIISCVGATSLAARSVFSVSPVEAMSPGEVADSVPRRGVSVWVAAIAGIAAVIGAWIIVATVPDRPAIAAGAVYALGALLICYACTRPLVAAVVWVARAFGGPGRLASVNTQRAPRRAWATLMTVAVAIAVGMGTSGALDNLVASISTSLEGLGDPDFYVSSSTEDEVPLGPILPPQIAGEVAAVPGVSQVLGGQWANVNVGEDRVLMQGLVPGSHAPFIRKATPAAVRQVLAGDGVILSNVLARTLGVHTGDVLRIATPTGYRETTVRDTVDYVAIDSGTAAMSAAQLGSWFDRPGDTYLQVMTAPDADKAQVRAALERIAADNPLDGGLVAQVYTGAAAVAATQRQAQQSGAFTVAIQWIVSAAAAIALLNTLLLSVIERRRELGVLRAMGASRRFLSRMVLAEAGAVALVGALLGLVIGAVLHLLADEILSATTSLDIAYAPRPITAVFVGVSVVLCLVGALVPARRAARMNITESIANE
ncbi:FtsX-like permease family protein [Gordonia sp. DT30]|uniref:FtsX-like permease family protein n=1 Tax=Gordonia sp. DT30 TaxID=3416546 RepID=UPI003CE73FDC